MRCSGPTLLSGALCCGLTLLAGGFAGSGRQHGECPVRHSPASPTIMLLRTLFIELQYYSWFFSWSLLEALLNLVQQLRCSHIVAESSGFDAVEGTLSVLRTR